MIGRINFYNQAKGYGFIAMTVPPKSPTEAPSQEEFFFHYSSFKNGEIPAIGAYVVFGLAPGIAEGKKIQAIGVRFATSREVGLAALANSGVL